VVAPITGTIIDITDVPDPVFAKKSVGDGFGISAPPGGTVVSPVTGTVMMVAKTLHAVGFKTESGLQFLVHLGIDTVELDGNPFTLTVTKGDKVGAGQIIGFTSFVNPEGVDSSFQGFWIASIVSIAVAFTLTYMFGFTDADVEGGREVKKVRLGNREPAHK